MAEPTKEVEFKNVSAFDQHGVSPGKTGKAELTAEEVERLVERGAIEVGKVETPPEKTPEEIEAEEKAATEAAEAEAKAAEEKAQAEAAQQGGRKR